MKIKLILALSRIKSEKAVELLGKALKDEDWEVRLYATEVLKAIGTSGALEALNEH